MIDRKHKLLSVRSQCSLLDTIFYFKVVILSYGVGDL